MSQYICAQLSIDPATGAQVCTQWTEYVSLAQSIALTPAQAASFITWEIGMFSLAMAYVVVNRFMMRARI